MTNCIEVFIYVLLMFSNSLRMIQIETCRSYDKLCVKFYICFTYVQ